MNLNPLATRAVRAAMRLRADLGIGITSALCPFDVAEKLGITVRLVALPSMEGMYSPTPKRTILLSSERPRGRRNFTCGHEIGHDIFGHGTRLDELSDTEPNAWSPEEFLAQRFASALLMPKLAVEAAFARRGWSIGTAGAERVFVIAQEFGVGYTTLVGHIEFSLKCMPSTTANLLRRASLSGVRSQLAGFNVEQDLMVVDKQWGSRPIDIEVGDIMMIPKTAEFTGSCATFVEKPVRHLCAHAPGIGNITFMQNRSAVLVRVARRGYTGLARYRYLEEVSDE